MGTGGTRTLLLGLLLLSADLPPTRARGLDRTRPPSFSNQGGYCRHLPRLPGSPGGGGGCGECNRDADCSLGKKCCWSECGNTCQTPEPNRCRLPRDPGPCKASLPQVFYNWQAKRCQEFIYGGCHGNLNRFNTMELCQLACGGQGKRSEAPPSQDC
ncbi:kunitz-type serine protease inhibitor 5-like [Candoia aspera]|uniref:kunitz-type serine protease inhibitor 5-like n=1 Tax=Candoia aspera TaxID=51853 RepID=UPI002FD8179D